MTGHRPRIVVNRHTPMVVEVFSRIGDVVSLETAAITAEAVRNADILVVRSETAVDRRLLKGSSVKFVGTVTIGEDHIDREYLEEQGIGFASAPGSNSTSVAEYIIAALLTLSARSGIQLTGAKIGIVGCGNVGSKVARCATALGMIPVINDPPLMRATHGAVYRQLDELMDADFITLHVPLTRSGPDPTYHLFDAHRIGAMKRGSVLLNTARGPVIDGAALHQALESRHLSSAILDVWEGEPEVNVDLLDRVGLGTPHIAGYSLDGKINALRMVYESACRFLGTQPGEVSAPGGNVRVVPPAGENPQESIRTVIRRSYDIEFDDQLLRGIRNVPASERGMYFRRLRSGYRTRREFSSASVSLDVHTAPLRKAFKDLGFLIEMPI